MPYILIENFAAGLDTRRHPMTAPPGTLRLCDNGHVTRGGEISKRRSFAPWKVVPSFSRGMAILVNDVYVFGSDAAPMMDPAIKYQRLQAPSGAPLVRVLSYDVFDAKLYVAALFADGTVAHFYNGVLVGDWYDGRARGTFKILGGVLSTGTATTASFEIVSGAAGSQISKVQIGTTTDPNLLTATITWTTDAATTAGLVVANINANGAAAYSAQADGGKVTLTKKTKDATDNGKTLNITKLTSPVMTISNLVNPTGGSAPCQVTSIKVDNIDIMAAPVAWASSNDATAAAIVAAINAFASVPNYEAMQEGPSIVIIATVPGAAANGRTAEVVSAGDISVIPANVTLTGGFDANTYVPGAYVKTIQTKMYSPSGPLLHFSGVEEPTKWTTDVIGAGFINMANQDGQSQELLAIERYYSRCAIFARRNVQIWQIDVDPANNSQVQVLRNTGLLAPGSVEQFGDNDVFYLSDSGVRSLRARDSSIAAAVNDIGTPIDEIITQAIHDAGDDLTAQAQAIIEPIAGRYWLALADKVYAYSNFPGGKVSAWSTYSPGFVITDFGVIGNQMLCRSGNTIYQIGGEFSDAFDTALLAIELPMLDASKPAHFKKWNGIDLVCEGHWRIYAGFEPLSPDARELIAEVDSPTLSMQRITLDGYGTHANIRLECDTAEAARLSNFILHYELADVG